MLSRDAFQLHGFAIVNSFTDAAGFRFRCLPERDQRRDDDPHMELVAAGIWERRPRDYFIVEDRLTKDLITHNELMAERAAQCLARRLHLPTSPSGK